MKNINEYISYQNNLNVLNEGFFDFVKKWLKRLFHALFKVKHFTELDSRLNQVESIIKYGVSGSGTKKTSQTKEKDTKKKNVNKTKDEILTFEFEKPEITYEDDVPTETAEINDEASRYVDKAEEITEYIDKTEKSDSNADVTEEKGLLNKIKNRLQKFLKSLLTDAEDDEDEQSNDPLKNVEKYFSLDDKDKSPLDRVNATIERFSEELKYYTNCLNDPDESDEWRAGDERWKNYYENALKELENAKEYLEKNNISNNETSNESIDNLFSQKRSRRRLNEAEDTESMISTNDENNIDIKKINMDIPSFPQVAAYLLKNLDTQIKELQTKLPETKIKNDLNAVKNNSRIDQRYVQQLEIIVTDFFKKYSSGSIQLPQPQKGKALNYDEMQKWNNFASSISKNSDTAFKSISDAMKRVVADYKESFDTELKDLLSREDAFIKDNKDGKSSYADDKFKNEWKQKITSKMNLIATSCEEYIPTAINRYFISSSIYNNASKYIMQLLELLLANSKNVANPQSNNIFLTLYNNFNDNKESFIKSANNILNSIKTNFKDVYDNVIGNTNYSFNENLLNEFFAKYDSLLKSKIFNNNDFVNKIIMQSRELDKMTAYILLKMILGDDVTKEDFERYGFIEKSNDNTINNNQQNNNQQNSNQ